MKLYKIICWKLSFFVLFTKWFGRDVVRAIKVYGRDVKRAIYTERI